MEDRIAADRGGDDYVTKLFSIEEVAFASRALLQVVSGVNDSRQRCPVSGRRLGAGRRQPRGDAASENQCRVTSTEFELLRFMMHNSAGAEQAQILGPRLSHDFGGRSNIVELYISYLQRSTTVANP